jgi:hypothetical protein
MNDNDFKGLCSQRGAALLIMFLALFMVSAAVLLKGLGNRNPSLRQDATIVKDLASAKEALLADAVMDDNPGHFPCPDTNNDGSAELTCGANAIGRLPVIFNRDFVTDQQLWYALTDAYRKNPAVGPASIINSTTSGALSLNGLNDVVAVIIAPGQALTGQSRPNNTIANYLEVGPVGGANYTTCSDPDTCNDKIVTISRLDIMSLITIRAAKEIKKEMDDYHTDNTKYPDDQTVFQSAMNPPLDSAAAWITDNQWSNITTYNRINPDTATIKFTDCAITFTLTSGSDTIVRSPKTCQ